MYVTLGPGYLNLIFLLREVLKCRKPSKITADLIMQIYSDVPGYQGTGLMYGKVAHGIMPSKLDFIQLIALKLSTFT